MCLLAETAHSLRHHAHSRNLASILAPYAARVLVVGVGAGCVGAVGYFLGSLATVTASWGDGELYFEKALEINQSLRAPSLIARTEYRYGEFLFERSWAGDREKALILLGQARETFARLKLFQPLKEVQSKLEKEDAAGGSTGDRERPNGVRGARDTRAGSPSCENFFRRQGASWLVSYQRRVSRLKHRKGIELLTILMKSPRQEFHVLELARGLREVNGGNNECAVRETNEQGFTVRDLGDAGPMIDARAGYEYRIRFQDLVREVEEARRMNDLGRVALVQGELNQLSVELRHSVGYKGRLRVARSVSERARISVKNNISAALRDIQRIDEGLWRHLMNSVKTGTFCWYDSPTMITCEVEE